MLVRSKLSFDFLHKTILVGIITFAVKASSNSYNLSETLEWLSLPYFVRADIMGPRLISLPSETDWLDQYTHPTAWLRWGWEARLRHEYIENANTITKNDPHNIQSYHRYRFRVWTIIYPYEKVSFHIGLNSEPRLFFMPFPGSNSGWDRTVGFFDELYLSITNLATLPINLKIGRQQIMLYDGWLVAEATPLDGSRAFSFDAIRLSSQFNYIKTKLDLIYIEQGAWNDSLLPTINNEPEPWATEDSRGIIFFLLHNITDWLELGQFFCYKHDYHPLIPYRRGNKGDIFTYGPLLGFMPSSHIYGYIEGAYQWGESYKRDINAYGINSKFGYLVKDQLNSELWLSCEYLTGDDPKTNNIEEFNILWGAWPRWSEIMLYAIGRGERQPYFLSNYYRIGIGYDAQPFKKFSVSLGYHAIYASEAASGISALNPMLFSRSGDFRGHLAQCFFRYQINKHISSHLWSEVLLPGDFYSYNDPFLFLRAEIKFQF